MPLPRGRWDKVVEVSQRGEHRAAPTPSSGALEEVSWCVLCTEQDFTRHVVCAAPEGLRKPPAKRRAPPPRPQALRVVHQYPENGMVWEGRPDRLSHWDGHPSQSPSWPFSRGSCRLESSAHMWPVLRVLRGSCLTFSNKIICFYFPCCRMK